MNSNNVIVEGSFIPKYRQLVDIVKKLVGSGKLKQGMKIPSENELKKKYRVSNTTVRKAINELLQEGIIYREQGKGTFLAKTKINQNLTKITSFTEDMLQRGLKPSSKVLGVTVISSPLKVMNNLILDKGEKVVKIHRLRLANGEPMAIQTSYFPHKLCPNIQNIQKQNLTQSLTIILRDRYNLHLVKAVQSLYPSLADDYKSKMLRIKKSAPVLIVERTSYLPNNQPAEFLESVYRGDRYEFLVELRR